jgi:beta-lactamase superfamily II metal-dependent hydrolase
MYYGVEVDMLSVGSADCIIATSWNGFVATRVLIDGGNKGDIDTLLGYLARNHITYFDAIVSTHHHDDHAAGLLELINNHRGIGIGKAYVHIPQNHVDMARVQLALKLAGNSTEADTIRKSLDTARSIVKALTARGIPIVEPFEGTQIEFLTVVGPSETYYEELVSEFTDADTIKKIDQDDVNYTLWSAIHDHINITGVIDTELPDKPVTTPENNSSAILATAMAGAKFLFTSDAGVPALQHASEAYDLKNCYWVQIPHHGSRRNINPALIAVFAPQVAFVSAEGTVKHPRRAVVNAFKQVGTRVYSTHYPVSTNMWQSYGTVPGRLGYTSLVPLYDKETTLPLGSWASILSKTR